MSRCLFVFVSVFLCVRVPMCLCLCLRLFVSLCMGGWLARVGVKARSRFITLSSVDVVSASLFCQFSSWAQQETARDSETQRETVRARASERKREATGPRTTPQAQEIELMTLASNNSSTWKTLQHVHPEPSIASIYNEAKRRINPAPEVIRSKSL